MRTSPAASACSDSCLAWIGGGGLLRNVHAKMKTRL
uniref:Uncharacterized protein n=1 Tax=Arundo donax TaxID=35708 RepID=A0A0A8ZDU9_ARUDO